MERRPGVESVLHTRDQSLLITPLHTFGGLPAHLIEVVYPVSRCSSPCPFTVVETDYRLAVCVQSQREIVCTFTFTVIIKDNERVAGY